MAEIPSTPADGYVAVRVLPAVADLSAPTLAEWTAGIDISCYLTSDGYSPSVDQQVATDERLCSTQVFEQPGRVTNSLDLIYIDNTNSPNQTTDNKAKDTLVPGSSQVIAVRRGMPYAAAAAAAQKVTLFPIKPGIYNELPGEANSVLKIGQKQFVTGPVSRSVALTA